MKTYTEKKKTVPRWKQPDRFKCLPLLAASLSILPGLGHLTLGKRGTAAALFFVDVGIIFSILFFKSVVEHLVTFFVYLIVAIPAVIESYVLAQGGVSRFSQSKPYIVIMLLIKGFFALPLLWQSHAFSNQVKIAWSIVVPALALLYYKFLSVYGIQLLEYAKTLFGQ